MEQAKKLGKYTRKNLTFPFIREWICEGKLTIEKIEFLADYERRSLESLTVRKLISQETLTIEQAIKLGLSESQVKSIESPAIQKLISQGFLTIAQVIKLGLSESQIKSLESPVIQKLISQGFLTIAQAIELWLSESQIKSLESPVIQELISQGSLTIEQAIELSEPQLKSLESPAIQKLISQGFLTIAQVIKLWLSEPQLKSLESPAIQKLISQGFLTIAQVIKLWFSESQIKSLESPVIQELISQGSLTIEQAIELSESRLKSLESPAVQKLISQGFLTIEQTIKLSESQIKSLEFPLIQVILVLLNNSSLTLDIEQGRFILDQAIEIDHSENLSDSLCASIVDLFTRLAPPPGKAHEFEFKSVSHLIINRIILLSEELILPALSNVQRINLSSKNIQNLIKNKTLSLWKALDLTQAEAKKLEFKEIIAAFNQEKDFFEKRRVKFQSENIVNYFKVRDKKYGYFSRKVNSQEFNHLVIILFNLFHIIDNEIWKERIQDYSLVERVYNLLVIFSNAEESNDIRIAEFLARIERFMEKHNTYNYVNPFKAAIPAELPILNVQLDLSAWREFIFDRGLIAFYLFRKASEYTFTEKPKILKQVLAGIALLHYGKDSYERNPVLAQLGLRYSGDDKSGFDEGLNKKLKTHDEIPNALIDGSQIGHPGYFLTKIPVVDPHIFFLGGIVGNCTSIYNKHGKPSILDAVTLPTSGFYVLLKHKKKKNISPLDSEGKINYDKFDIVGAGYCWLSQNDFVIDSWKNLRKTDEAISVAMLRKLAKTLGETSPEIMRVLIGDENYMDFGRETPEGLLTERTDHPANMVVCTKVFPESREQAILYFDKEKADKNSKELDAIIHKIVKKNYIFDRVSRKQNLDYYFHKLKSVINPETYPISSKYLEWIKVSFLTQYGKRSIAFLNKILENSEYNAIFEQVGYHVWHSVFSLNIYQARFADFENSFLIDYLYPIFSLKLEQESKVDILKDFPRAINQLDSIGQLTRSHLEQILKKFPGFNRHTNYSWDAVNISQALVLAWQEKNGLVQPSICDTQTKIELDQLELRETEKELSADPVKKPSLRSNSRFWVGFFSRKPKVVQHSPQNDPDTNNFPGRCLPGSAV